MQEICTNSSHLFNYGFIKNLNLATPFKIEPTDSRKFSYLLKVALKKANACFH